MTRLDIIEEFENETELPATWNSGGMGGYTDEYTKWLEQKLVKNLAIPVVKPRTFDPEFDEVECDYYELEQGLEDNADICHLGLEIECCTHCYMNKALYGA